MVNTIHQKEENKRNLSRFLLNFKAKERSEAQGRGNIKTPILLLLNIFIYILLNAYSILNKGVNYYG